MSLRKPRSEKTPPWRLTTAQLLEFYDVVLRESDYTKIAAGWGVSAPVLKRRLEKYPELRQALSRANASRPTRDTFKGYIFKHLSPEAREVWREIVTWEDKEGRPPPAEYFKEFSIKLRQELFIHALVDRGWNPSEACSMSGVTLSALNHWRTSNREFEELIQEIRQHKKNFYESALDNLVAQGNIGAIIFANKTQNADRGYNDKIQIDHKMSQVGGGGINIDELDLPNHVMREILDAVRRKKMGTVVEVKAIAEKSEEKDEEEITA